LPGGHHGGDASARRLWDMLMKSVFQGICIAAGVMEAHKVRSKKLFRPGAWSC
jgi:hypothetical protein